MIKHQAQLLPAEEVKKKYLPINIFYKPLNRTTAKCLVDYFPVAACPLIARLKLPAVSFGFLFLKERFFFYPFRATSLIRHVSSSDLAHVRAAVIGHSFAGPQFFLC